MRNKRWPAVILVLVLLLMLFCSGCSGEPEPLRICVDADSVGTNPKSCETIMQSFLDTIAMMGGPSDVVLEIVPRSGVERETAIDRIRTEIMSGKGPDVFIVPCGDGYLTSEPSLFPVPEKTLEIGIFLPLDKYIENAQFMDWDKQTEVVMAAGRNEYGQQIIPLTYTLPLTFYRAFETEGIKPGAETTWADMLADESGVLKTAATWDHVDFAGGETYFVSSEDNYLEYILGDFADYKTDTLLFTEEELLQRTTEVLELEKAYDTGKISAPAHYQTLLYPTIDLPPYNWYSIVGGRESYRGIKFEDDQTMIPIYSDDGGTTASITSFAAVNANTKRPEDAFYVIDLMLRVDYQQKWDLYEEWLAGHSAGIPVYEGLLSQQYPIGLYYFKNENYEEFFRVREQITHVRFRGGLAAEFDDMYAECKLADAAGEDIAPIVSRYYDTLKMMMAE